MPFTPRQPTASGLYRSCKNGDFSGYFSKVELKVAAFLAILDNLLVNICSEDLATLLGTHMKSESFLKPTPRVVFTHSE